MVAPTNNLFLYDKRIAKKSQYSSTLRGAGTQWLRGFYPQLIIKSLTYLYITIIKDDQWSPLQTTRSLQLQVQLNFSHLAPLLGELAPSDWGVSILN